MSCPKCSGTHVDQFRMPTGYLICRSCGFHTNHKEWYNKPIGKFIKEFIGRGSEYSIKIVSDDFENVEVFLYSFFNREYNKWLNLEDLKRTNTTHLDIGTITTCIAKRANEYTTHNLPCTDKDIVKYIKILNNTFTHFKLNEDDFNEDWSSFELYTFKNGKIVEVSISKNMTIDFTKPLTTSQIIVYQSDEHKLYSELQRYGQLEKIMGKDKAMGIFNSRIEVTN